MSYQQKIEETLSRSVCGGWDRGFLESILSQMSKDKKLSVKQKQTLGKVLARNTPEAQRSHEGWRETYNKDYKADARVLAAYHKQQPYYRNMAEDILNDRVPERSRFLRMYDNKYSKKVLSQYHIAPRYDTGEYVVPRAGLDSYKHIEFQGDMVWTNQNRIVTNFKKRGGFILEICAEIKNAAKGAKRYKLLTIGETEPIIIEERYIKRAPKVSK